MNFVQKIQSKPRYVRTQILWVSVILVMIAITFIWVIYLKAYLNYSEKKEAQNTNQSAPSLFDTLKEDFSFLKNNIKSEINGLWKKNNQ